MRIGLCVFAISAMLVAELPVQAAGKVLGGKQIFLAQKCNLCHSVSTANITRVGKSAATRGPDLVNLTTDAPRLAKWLHGQAKRDGKVHAKTFAGGEEELSTLIAWLQAQKK